MAQYYRLGIHYYEYQTFSPNFIIVISLLYKFLSKFFKPENSVFQSLNIFEMFIYLVTNVYSVTISGIFIVHYGKIAHVTFYD